jgi:hypothetical protein
VPPIYHSFSEHALNVTIETTATAAAATTAAAVAAAPDVPPIAAFLQCLWVKSQQLLQTRA